jgi:hypothetical protein
MKRTVSACLCLSFALSGCATAPSTWTPQIDTQNVNQAKYAQDFADCKKFAQANPDTDAAKASKHDAIKYGVGTAAIMGAATIATGGLALIPIMAGTLAVGAGGGAVAGAMGATASADAKYKDVITRCLAGRGYHVIG